MAIAQGYRSGVARALEISTDAGATWTDIGGQTGREAVSYTLNVTSPSNPVGTNSTAMGNESKTNLEVAFSFSGARTSVSAPIMDPLLEPTEARFRVADRNRATGVTYTEVAGIPAVTLSWTNDDVQMYATEVHVNADPVEGQFS